MIQYIVIFLLIWLVFGALFILRRVLIEYNEKMSKKPVDDTDSEA